MIIKDNNNFYFLIRTKTVYLQRIKSRISQEIDCIESETKSIIEFKNELDLLVQEERAHLEELRQIQNDISVVILTKIILLKYNPK